MTFKSRKKASKGRYNILLMRSKGEVMNLAVSPFFLLLAFVFALVFIVVSVSIMNRYFALYLDHRDLSAAYEETAEELNRLQSLYTYQASVADDYSNLMQALNRADPAQDPNGEAPLTDLKPETPPASGAGEEPAAATPPPGTGESTEAETAPPGTESPEAAAPGQPASLEEWAALLPPVAPEPEQILDVENLRASGGRFSFSLVSNDPDGRAAQGRLLMAFSIKTPDGNTRIVAYPEFDLTTGDPDFELGSGYNIRAGKTVAGRLSLPSGGELAAVMAAAKSRAGNIVMKKLLLREE